MRHHSERSLATHFLFRCRGLHRRSAGWSGVSRCEHAIRYKAHRGVNAKKHEERNLEIIDDGLAHTRPVAERISSPMVRCMRLVMRRFLSRAVQHYFLFFLAAIFARVSFTRNFTIFLIKLNGTDLSSGNWTEPFALS